MNTTIYCIKSQSTRKVYIGSSTRKINYRLNEHRNQYNRFLNKKDFRIYGSYDVLQHKDHYISAIYSGIFEDGNAIRDMEKKIISIYYSDPSWIICNRNSKSIDVNYLNLMGEIRSLRK